MMAGTDILVGVTAGPMMSNLITKKPSHLITLESDSKGKYINHQRFITLDKPELLNGFIQVKGIFSLLSENEIIESFSDILADTPKESILEILFPWHRIICIRSLVFRAK
jgi:hypothetical protein